MISITTHIGGQLTSSNVFTKTENSGNTISILKEVTEPFYDRVTGGLSQKEIDSMPIRGYHTCEKYFNSYFADIVSVWVDDTTIKPLGWVRIDGEKNYFWGNNEVVFHATANRLIETKKEVAMSGYSGQLGCMPWKMFIAVYKEKVMKYMPRKIINSI